MLDDDIETVIEKLFSMKNFYRVISKVQTGSRRNFFRDVDNDAKTFSYLTFIERQAGSDRFSLCCGYLIYIKRPLLAPWHDAAIQSCQQQLTCRYVARYWPVLREVTVTGP